MCRWPCEAESLIILVTHRTQARCEWESETVDDQQQAQLRHSPLTISLLMWRMYRSILLIWSLSAFSFAFFTLLWSSSVSVGHSFTSYDLLTIIEAHNLVGKTIFSRVIQDDCIIPRCGNFYFTFFPFHSFLFYAALVWIIAFAQCSAHLQK